MSKKVLDPATGRLIVKRIDASEKKVGSLIVPVQAQKRSNTAIVVAVGNDEEYSVGDEVLLSDTAGVRFQWDNEDLLVIRTSEVLVRVR